MEKTGIERFPPRWGSLTVNAVALRNTVVGKIVMAVTDAVWVAFPPAISLC